MTRVYAIRQASGVNSDKYVVTSNKVSAAGYPLAKGGRTSLPMSYEDAKATCEELNRSVNGQVQS